MDVSLKEHRSRVSDIRVNRADNQAVSASFDGSVIIWDIVNNSRIMCLFESTMFRQVVYHPDESQVLTTGSNRKITYWDCFDGQAIRMLDGSETGEVNALAMSDSGEMFVSGGQDKRLKVWDYDEGEVRFEGVGHSGDIVKIALSPDQRSLVSVGAEGAIFVWGMPERASA
jgi:WD40 repeat protein